jgi:lantibiotic modifying enzyme
LRLFEATRDARLAEIAVLCGDHLVAQRSDAGNGLRSWATIGGKYLAGFSHGAAGMSYSLSRLTEVLGERRFKDAALEATGYEATLFNERENNWPNLLAPMKEGGYAFWNSWCHGAPGIGLARVGSLATSDSSEYRRDIAHGVKSASDAPLNSLDNLCCGTLGRLDVLLEAHRVLGEGQCLDRARQLAKAVVVRAAERGGYVVGPQTGIYVPSLYQGMAGVGYQLLRVANPSAYPSVLCFQ